MKDDYTKDRRRKKRERKLRDKERMFKSEKKVVRR